MVKVSASVDVVSVVSQGSVLGLFLNILYTFKLFGIVVNHIAAYADDTTISVVFPRSLSRPQVMKSLNQSLAAIDSWCSKRYMRLNTNETKSMVVSRSQSYAPRYGDLTLGGTKFEEVRSLSLLGITLDSKLTFETHLREVLSKVARSLVVC